MKIKETSNNIPLYKKVLPYVIFLCIFISIPVILLNLISSDENIIEENNNEELNTSNENISVIISPDLDDISNFISFYKGEYTPVIDSIEQTEKSLFTQKDYSWNIFSSDGNRAGKLYAKVYNFKNSDVYYFLSYESHITSSEPLEIVLPYTLDDFEFRYVKYPDDEINNVTSIIDGPFTSETYNSIRPASTSYIDSNNLHLGLSYSSVFTPLQNEVIDESYSKGLNPIVSDEGKIIIRLANNENTVVQQWGIISEQDDFIRWDDAFFYDSLRIADLNRVRKWCDDGQYNQIYTSYYPTSTSSYWRIPAAHIADAFLRNGGGLFFSNYSIIALYASIEDQNIYGYWFSTPRSNWLYDDYGISAYFYDTRFSTDAGLFLIRGYRKYKDEAFLQSAVEYGDFLISHAERSHHETTNGGWLVYDYANALNPDIVTHTSLNHHVTEIYFLLELYTDTQDSKYLDTVTPMLQGIKDTKNEWEKENGDLWYAYSVDGTYILDDYPDLTLKDLKYLQKMLTSIYGEADNDIQYLIDIKQEYYDNMQR